MSSLTRTPGDISVVLFYQSARLWHSQASEINEESYSTMMYLEKDTSLPTPTRSPRISTVDSGDGVDQLGSEVMSINLSFVSHYPMNIDTLPAGTPVLGNYAYLGSLDTPDPAKVVSLHRRIAYVFKDPANYGLISMELGSSAQSSRIRVIRTLAFITSDIRYGPWGVMAGLVEEGGRNRALEIALIVRRAYERFCLGPKDSALFNLVILSHYLADTAIIGQRLYQMHRSFDLMYEKHWFISKMVGDEPTASQVGECVEEIIGDIRNMMGNPIILIKKMEDPNDIIADIVTAIYCRIYYQAPQSKARRMLELSAVWMNPLDPGVFPFLLNTMSMSSGLIPFVSKVFRPIDHFVHALILALAVLTGLKHYCNNRTRPDETIHIKDLSLTYKNYIDIEMYKSLAVATCELIEGNFQGSEEARRWIETKCSMLMVEQMQYMIWSMSTPRMPST